jgi:hypothetical protein
VHGARDDSILEHRSIDFNANLAPDGASSYLVAGSRAGHTNNYWPGFVQGERGRLHFEWESLTLPFFAWPTDGDRATIWGSWIWDCGHWSTTENNTGGGIIGEATEFHPLNAIAVNRHAPYLSARSESQTDVFVSNQGDPAHAVEKCALSHHPATGASYPQYDPGFNPCAQSSANQLQPLERSYSFFVPAPPKTSALARLRYRIVNRIPGGSGSQRVTVKRNGIQVKVTLHNAGHVVSYGKSFFVSWAGPVSHPPVPLKLTLKSILIKHADPNPSVPDPSGAHWNLYLDFNGYWQLLNKWAPRLTTHVVDGERIAINRTVRIFVPRGAPVSLLVQGRECDEPAGKTVFGVFTHLLYPCPANTDEQNPNIFAIFLSDDTGTILKIYRSPSAALGTHGETSKATVNFPGTGPVTFFDGHMGQGDYRLSYTIRPG